MSALEQTVGSLTQQVTSQGQQIADLNQRVSSLENAWQPVIFHVNCGAGQTVAGALGEAARRTGPVTIMVWGICTEAVTIGRDDITVQGSAPGAGLQAPMSSSTILNLRAQRTQLELLTLTGGGRGIHAHDGASFYASNLLVSGASGAGISVQTNAAGVLVDSTVENSRSGIIVSFGGHLTVSGGVIRNSTSRGIFAGSGAAVSLNNGVVVQDTGGFGVGVHASWNSFVDIAWATVERSATFGIQAWGGADVRVGQQSLIQTSGAAGVLAHGATVDLSGCRVAGNTGPGVEVDMGGSAVIHHGAIVENNQQGGALVNAASALRLSEGAVVRANLGNGISLSDTSVAHFFQGNNQIINNQGWGIFCRSAPSVAMVEGQIGTVSGNSAGQNNCPSAFAF